MAACTYLDQVHPVTPQSDGCAECLLSGSAWVHLRMCLVCGHVGCCDSSAGKHATRHFEATEHPVMRSIEKGDHWGWCYLDQMTLDLPE